MMPIEIEHLAAITDVGNFDDLMFAAIALYKVASDAKEGSTISALFVFSGYQASSDEDTWFKRIVFAVASRLTKINFDIHVVKVEEAALPSKKRYFDDRAAYDLISSRWPLEKSDHVPSNVSWIAPELSASGHKTQYVLHNTCPFFINAPFSIDWIAGEDSWIDAGFTNVIIGLGYNSSKILPFEADKYDGNKDRSKEQLEVDLRKLSEAGATLIGVNGYFSAGSHKTIKNIGKVSLSAVPNGAGVFHEWGQVVSGAFCRVQSSAALENARAAGNPLDEYFPAGCDPFAVLMGMSDKDEAASVAQKLFAASYAHAGNSYHHPETGNGLKAVLSFLTNPEVEFSDPITFMLYFLCKPDLEQRVVDNEHCCLVDGRLKLERDIPEDDDGDYLEICALVARDPLAVQQSVFDALAEIDGMLMA